MKNRFLLLTSTVLLAMVFLSACSSADDQTGSTPAQSVPAATSASMVGSGSAAADRVFTAEELATYNGKDGQPAYVAVDGVVYDVTDVPQWANGEHANGLTAGQDLTEEITNESPHGLSVLDDLPVVGTLE